VDVSSTISGQPLQISNLLSASSAVDLGAPFTISQGFTLLIRFLVGVAGGEGEVEGGVEVVGVEEVEVGQLV